MTDRPEDGARPGPPRPDDAAPARPPRIDMKREIIGSVLGAIGGAAIAQALGANEQVPSAAIAGAFVGPGLIAVARRTWAGYSARRR